MKLLFLIDSLAGMGGAERSLLYLSRGLVQHGHQVFIFCLKGGEISRNMIQSGFSVVDLDIARIYDLKGLSAIWALGRFIQKEKISAFISVHEASDFIGIFLSKLFSVPIVSSRRDQGFKLNRRHVLVYKLINRYFDRIATVSNAVKEVVQNDQGANPENVQVIPNGIGRFLDGEELHGVWEPPDGLKVCKESVNICCLANIHPIKGQDILIDAASLIIKKFKKVKLYLVGHYDENEKYYRSLRSKLASLGLDEYFFFTGRFHPSRIGALLTRMDISVLPSLSEGMSNAVLESMMAGIPVVASTVGGNPELIVDGETGLLVPPGNAAALAKSIGFLIEYPEVRKKMGLQAMNRVKTEFTLEKMVEGYENLLVSVVNKREKSKARPPEGNW